MVKELLIGVFNGLIGWSLVWALVLRPRNGLPPCEWCGSCEARNDVMRVVDGQQKFISLCDRCFDEDRQWETWVEEMEQ